MNDARATPPPWWRRLIPNQLGWIERGVVVCLLLCSGGLAFGQSQDASEYELKGAFLYNIARFVEWQPTKTESSMTFCIASDEAVARQMEKDAGGHGKSSPERSEYSNCVIVPMLLNAA